MLDAQSSPANVSGATFPHVDDHPHYGLSINLGNRHYLAARPNGSGQGWRVEDSRPGDLRILVRSCTREQAYALVAEMADAVAPLYTTTAAA